MEDRITTQVMDYAGFWDRLGASIIDGLLAFLVLLLLFSSVFGVIDLPDDNPVGLVQNLVLILSYILPVAITLAFWIAKGATPGKMALRLRIVDAKSGEPASKVQLTLRYLGYYVSSLPFCLGFLWVAIDKRKQGWHDKIAGTVVLQNAENTADIRDVESVKTSQI